VPVVLCVKRDVVLRDEYGLRVSLELFITYCALGLVLYSKRYRYDAAMVG
jgi:hypothetical protein